MLMAHLKSRRLNVRPPSNSHYVQKAYLDGFADGQTGCVWLYEKGRRTPKSVPPAACCRTHGYYRFRLASGETVDLEHSDWLNESEGKGLGILRSLGPGTISLAGAERISLAQYLALSVLRTPAYANAFMRSILATAPPRPETVSDAKDSSSISRPLHVGLVVASVEALGETIAKMDWKCLFAPPGGAYFITTDNPWAPVGHDGKPLSRHGVVNALSDCARLLFPLRKDMCLMARPGQESFIVKQIDTADVQWINAYQISNAYRYKISPVPDLLSLLPPNSQWDESAVA
jgi:hypothetical protein